MKLRDMNITVPATEGRAIEVLAIGLLAIGITFRSALIATGKPCPNAATMGGAVLARARRDKGHQVRGVGPRRGVETGGRFSEEAAKFMDWLAVARAPRGTWCAAPLRAFSLASSLDANIGGLLESFVPWVPARSDSWSGTDGPAPGLAL